MQAQYFKSNQDYLKRVDSQITTTNLSVNAEDTMRGFYTHLFARSFQQLMLPSYTLKNYYIIKKGVIFLWVYM